MAFIRYCTLTPCELRVSYVLPYIALEQGIGLRGIAGGCKIIKEGLIYVA